MTKKAAILLFITSVIAIATIALVVFAIIDFFTGNRIWTVAYLALAFGINAYMSCSWLNWRLKIIQKSQPDIRAALISAITKTKAN